MSDRLWNGTLLNLQMTGINGSSSDGLVKVKYYIIYLLSTIPQYELSNAHRLVSFLSVSANMFIPT